MILLALPLAFLFGEASLDWEKYIPENQNKNIRYGATQLIGESITSITINGPTVLDRATILDRIEVNGTINASKSKINHLIVNGNFSGFELNVKEIKVNGTVGLSSSIVSGTLTVYGLLNANECDFNGLILIDSSETYFNKSNIQDITILNNSFSLNTQKIYLKDNTAVNGKIIFKGGNGEVILSGNSTVTSSQIVGGKIFKKD